MKLILAILSLMVLSACATTKPALQSSSSEFGSAVRHNIAAQAIEPLLNKRPIPSYLPMPLNALKLVRTIAMVRHLNLNPLRQLTRKRTESHHLDRFSILLLLEQVLKAEHERSDEPHRFNQRGKFRRE